MNNGDIVGYNGSFTTFATGPVTVGQNGVGGGLVGRNSYLGYIDTTKATGAVTGLAGTARIVENFKKAHDSRRPGRVQPGAASLSSYAAGNPSVRPASNWLTVGGFVGDNSGLYRADLCHRQRARRQLQRWPADFVGSGDSGVHRLFDGVGSIYSNINLIASSSASGHGQRRLVKHRRRLRGRRQLHLRQPVERQRHRRQQFDPWRLCRRAQYRRPDLTSPPPPGPVTATGPSTWAGGFVGYNGGVDLRFHRQPAR